MKRDGAGDPMMRSANSVLAANPARDGQTSIMHESHKKMMLNNGQGNFNGNHLQKSDQASKQVPAQLQS